MSNARLWKEPTTVEIAAELRARIAINRRNAERVDDGRCVLSRTCEHTAEELERLLFWIEGPQTATSIGGSRK